MNFHDAIDSIKEDPTKIIRSNYTGEIEGIIWLDTKAVWWPYIEEEPFPFVFNDECLESEWEVLDLKQEKETSMILS